GGGGRGGSGGGERRGGAGGKRRRRGHRARPGQQHRSMDRGGWRARKRKDQASALIRSRAASGARFVGRPPIRAGPYLRADRRRDRKFPEQHFALSLEKHPVGIQHQEGQQGAEGGGLEGWG